MQNPQTPWGWPVDSGSQSGFAAFVSQYGVWLLVGGLVLLGMATGDLTKGRAK